MSITTSFRKVSFVGGFVALAALAVFLIIGQMNATVSADEEDGVHKFLGFYVGINADDGGRFELSITDNDGDGVPTAYMHEEVWGICGDIPALVTGPGTVVGSTLDASMTITCDDGTVISPVVLSFERIDKNTLELSGPVSPSPVHRVGE